MKTKLLLAVACCFVFNWSMAQTPAMMETQNHFEPMQRLHTPINKSQVKKMPFDATSGKCGDNLTWSFNSSTGLLTITGNGAMYDFEDIYDDAGQWLGCNTPWYGYASTIIAVSLPKGLTSIGYNAFSECEKLTSITIPNSVTSIGAYALCNCSSLTSATIGNSVTSIGQAAFAVCSSLTSVTIPESVTSIEQGATFQKCTSLKSVQWNAKNCMIEKNENNSFSPPFFNLSNITNFSFGENVEAIPVGLCYGLSGLTAINLPRKVTSIGYAAFNGCSGLTSVTIPESVTSIEQGATFQNCTSLKSVQWNAKKCTIDKSSNGDYYPPFNNLSNITNFSFGEDVETIPAYLCAGLSGLTAITLPHKVTNIGSSAFYNCSSLTSVTIPNSVTNIGDGAFSGCSGLTSVTIGNGVTSIGYDAFNGCSSLASITIPNSVTNIGIGAFYGCSSLTSINIPNSVTSIGEEAFYNCSSLTSATIGNNVIRINDRTFADCSSLASVTIGNSITSIGNWAFQNCSSLTSVTIPNSVTSIGYYAFQKCGLTSATIGNSVTSIGTGAFRDCSSLTSITIPESVTSIGQGATFQECTALESVHWNAKNCTMEEHGNGSYYPPFHNLSNITNFSFGENVETIPYYLCDGLSGLKSIIIPSKMKRFGYNYAFNGCSNLTSVTLNSNSVLNDYDFVYETYGSYSLRDVFGSNVKEYIIGNGVTSIGDYAFVKCYNLTSITISNSVTGIGYKSFCYCTNLDTLSLGKNISQYGDQAFAGCSKISTIYNYRERPAKLGSETFKDVDYFNCTLYVLAGSVDMYKSSGSDWKDFYFIEPIGATSVTTNNVNVSVTNNTATVTWPFVENAETFELIITDKNGQPFLTLTFNSQGQLVNMAFADAPGRSHSSTQSAGFSFTVTGLNSGTTYNLTINAKDSNGQILQTTTQAFTTEGITGVADIVTDITPTKVIRNGQLFILRGDKTYTIQGQEVR